MRKLAHYFTSFQTYVVAEGEDERGRFDLHVAFEILRYDAEYRAAGASRPGAFLYQFECLCRNRLRYEKGLDAMALDPIYDEDWRKWLETVRRQIGIVDVADLIYVRSQYYADERIRRYGELDSQRADPVRREGGQDRLGQSPQGPALPVRRLATPSGLPAVPRPKPVDETLQLVPQLLRRMERLETRTETARRRTAGWHRPDASSTAARTAARRPIPPHD